MTKRLIVVDISNFIFRAFYAIRPLTSPDGTPVNAVFGVLNMMLKLLSQYQPTHMFLARDSKEGNFRKDFYPEYKAHRPEQPEDLVVQFPLIETLINKMGLPNAKIINYEADDIIGSAVVQWEKNFDEIFIASGDKDLMQFVNDKIKVLDTMKDIIYDKEKVVQKMGVRPDQIVDYLSIMGDASDNIPGMKGIGAKGATNLLTKHDNLEECIKVKDTFSNKRVKNAFENHLDDALLSKKLVTIVTDLDLGMVEDDIEFSFYPSNQLIDFLKELNFKSMLKKVDEIKYGVHQANKMESKGEFEIVETLAKVEFEFTNRIVKNEKDFLEVTKILQTQESISVYIKFSDSDIINRKIISITCSSNGKETYYFPFAHRHGLVEEFPNLDLTMMDELLNLCFEDREKEICLEEAKDLFIYYLVNDKEIQSRFFDISLAQYVIDPSMKNDLSYQASALLNFDLTELDKSSLANFDEIDSNQAAQYCGERAGILFILSQKLQEKIKSEECDKVYYDIELPLVPILAGMEREGIYLNHGYLRKLETEFASSLNVIEKEIEKCIEEVGGSIPDEPINLRSPKQVSELLFTKLNLPVIKKTKTGFSTDSEVLEDLNALNVSKVPGLILEYRELDKLLSTYVKALPQMINSSTNRIHTRYLQHGVATGRLASERPNLQNIPVRSANGRRIRKGFIATPGKILLSADYSQVELRLLANMSEDPTMISYFIQQKDIHAQTASEVLGMPLDQITSKERSIAKGINFGLMYGQSSFGLSKALKITRSEAKEYITKYFERFDKVKVYLDSLKEFCERNGFVETHFGRRRYLKDIHSSNRNIKSRAERTAINSPIQGTAADIVKIAMINIDRKMKENNLKSKMLLQVHDELIFEVVDEEVQVMKEIVKDGMENVAKFQVPLTVNLGIGVNWFDLK